MIDERPQREYVRYQHDAWWHVITRLNDDNSAVVESVIINDSQEPIIENATEIYRKELR